MTTRKGADQTEAKSKGASRRMRRPPTLYSRAFEEATKLIPQVEKLEARIAETTSKPLRRLYEKKITSMNEAFDRLSGRHRDINRLVANYARANEDKIDNVSDVIRYLKRNGIQIVYEDSQGDELTERAVRIHISKTWGIVKKPRRKKP